MIDSCGEPEEIQIRPNLQDEHRWAQSEATAFFYFWMFYESQDIFGGEVVGCSRGGKKGVWLLVFWS